MKKTAAQQDAEPNYSEVLERFRAINDERLAQTYAALRESQRNLLNLLPLLFHINHPSLPGFTSQDTPVGVYGYEPDERSLNLARRFAGRNFQYRSPSRRKNHPVQAIYFMGSAGTIAFEEGSDIDIWLVIDSGMEPDELNNLEQKARKIEAEAAKAELEIHFFLVNPETFREGVGEELSSESSGSAQHNLLLEEFYRTGILQAGRFPMWWLVPPDEERDYDEVVDRLQEHRFVQARDAIDFGGLALIPAEEFFGAAVWQLSKGISSPYKSALKLMLIEAYAFEYPQIELLSLRFKHAVYNGETDPERLDAYNMMLDKVTEHLERSSASDERVEVARRCFYFKLNEPLSKPQNRKHPNRRRERIEEVVGGWSWSKSHLLLMDHSDNWNVERVADERRILFDTLTASYRFLSDFARKFAGMSMISQRDLNILGRKLYAAYERKAGKIELLTRGMQSSLHESHISLYEVPDEKHSSRWLLYRGVVQPQERRSATPVKRSRSIIELLAWCYFNSILDKNTHVALFTNDSNMNPGEIRQVTDRLHQLFPAKVDASGDMEDFARPAYLRQSALFINMGINTREHQLLRSPPGLAGGNDALSYGHAGQNLAVALDHLLTNSWGEVLCNRYSGTKGVVEFLCDYLKWAPLSRGEAPPGLRTFGASSSRGSTVAHRIDELLSSATSAFYDTSSTPESRYVFTVSRGYYLLQRDGDTLSYTGHPNLASLMQELGKASKGFSPLTIDRYALRDTPLPSICEVNRPGVVQLFYLPGPGEVEIFILDERGALFHQVRPNDGPSNLLNHYQRFFESVTNRINFLLEEGSLQESISGVEFYAIKPGADGYQLSRKAPGFGEPAGRYYSLQVIAEKDDNGRNSFTLYCDDKEFSSLEHGKGLFGAVVEHVLRHRQGGKTYPIYITDISLAPAMLGENGAGRAQTARFLLYKQRIEEQLNAVLQKMARS